MSSRLDDIQARGVLQVGTTGDYKPYSYRPTPEAEFIGSDMELASDLAASLGVRLEIVPTTWSELMADQAKGRFDLALGGISISLERQRQALFSIPYQREDKTDAPFDFAEKAVLLPRDPYLKAYVDQWLHQLIATGRLQEVQDRWLAYPWSLQDLGQLIDARLLLAIEVARYKWNSGDPIEDLPREARIIAGLGQQAAAYDLPVAWVETFFRAQIEASKTLQREYFACWQAEGRGKIATVNDLNRQIRPRLDALTPQLLRALSHNKSILLDPAQVQRIGQALGPLESARLSPAAAAQALSPLRQESDRNVARE